MAKNLPFGHHRTTLSGCIYTKACIGDWEKLLKQQYLLHTSSQYGELRPNNSWNWFSSLCHPSKFQWVSHLAFVNAAMSLTRGPTNFAQCLAVSWAATLCIHFWGHLPPHGILPSTKCTLCPSLAFCIGSVTAWHSSNGHQPNFAAWYKEWNYGTFAEDATYIRLGGHHVHQPTF